MQGGNHFEGFVEEVEEYYFEDEDGNGCGCCVLWVGVRVLAVGSIRKVKGPGET